MKAFGYSVTKEDVSSILSRQPNAGARKLWSHSLLTQKDAKFVAESDSGTKLTWLRWRDYIAAESGDVEYTVRPIFVKSANEAMSELRPASPKPRKKPARP